MRMYIKKVLALFVLMLGLITLGSVAYAQTTPYDITTVAVDDVVISTGATSDAVFVERGERAKVEVFLDGNTSTDNVRVRAWIGGYEYGSIEDETSIFEVLPGVDYRKVLYLDIPEDLDASDLYTLNIEVFDDDTSVRSTFNLRVEEKRHSLRVMDILLRPNSVVKAGDALFVKARVENLGAKKEDDIKVTASIRDLGISGTVYIDELTENEVDDGREEKSETSDEVYLRIPETAATGVYDVVVEVEYNRGHDTVTKSDKIRVEGETGASATTVDRKAIVNVDTASRTLESGAEAAYKIMVANFGSRAAVYSAEVAGEKLWASSRLEPGFITVAPDSTGELYVYVKAFADVPAGKHVFTVKVKEGTAVVNEVNLVADVVGTDAKTSVTDSVGSTKKALVIGFGVLVVILVILGLIIAFNRMKDDDEGEIPTSSEGQAYY